VVPQRTVFRRCLVSGRRDGAVSSVQLGQSKVVAVGGGKGGVALQELSVEGADGFFSTSIAVFLAVMIYSSAWLPGYKKS
jgi:hypothetical protein